MTRVTKSGFSLIELIVSLSLGLFLIAIMINSTSAIFRSGRSIEQAGEVAETGRYLSDLLTTELRLAGFFGQLSYRFDSSAVLPDICAGPTAAGLNNAMAFPIQGMSNVPAGQRLCGGDLLLAGSDVLLMRRADTRALVAGSKLTPTQHYIQAIGDSFVVATGAEQSNFNLSQADGLTAAPIRAWHQTIYYVSADKNFKRRRFYRGALSPSEPLAEGVDDFQLVYGIDKPSVGNGQNQQPTFVHSPGSKDGWANTIAVEFYLLVSNTGKSSAIAEQKSYSYADKSGLVFRDNKKRRLVKGFVALENSRARRGQ
jgi:type IV pilus assembly protein PilW